MVKKPKLACEYLVEKGLVDFLGSDIHSMRYFDSLKILSKRKTRKIFEKNQIKIILFDFFFEELIKFYFYSIYHFHNHNHSLHHNHSHIYLQFLHHLKSFLR